MQICFCRNKTVNLFFSFSGQSFSLDGLEAGGMEQDYDNIDIVGILGQIDDIMPMAGTNSPFPNWKCYEMNQKKKRKHCTSNEKFIQLLPFIMRFDFDSICSVYYTQWNIFLPGSSHSFHYVQIKTSYIFFTTSMAKPSLKIGSPKRHLLDWSWPI